MMKSNPGRGLRAVMLAQGLALVGAGGAAAATSDAASQGATVSELTVTATETRGELPARAVHGDRAWRK